MDGYRFQSGKLERVSTAELEDSELILPNGADIRILGGALAVGVFGTLGLLLLGATTLGIILLVLSVAFAITYYLRPELIHTPEDDNFVRPISKRRRAIWNAEEGDWKKVHHADRALEDEDGRHPRRVNED